MLGPEWKGLHAALAQLHKRILYERVDIEHVGYDQALFDLAVRAPGNRTLADILVWILEAGGELQAVQILGGEWSGPVLTRDNLRQRWERLDPADLEGLAENDDAAVRVLRTLLGLNVEQ
jgi:hypothetical protein